jgi:hypothetical protein
MALALDGPPPQMNPNRRSGDYCCRIVSAGVVDHMDLVCTGSGLYRPCERRRHVSGRYDNGYAASHHLTFVDAPTAMPMKNVTVFTEIPTQIQHSSATVILFFTFLCVD